MWFSCSIGYTPIMYLLIKEKNGEKQMSFCFLCEEKEKKDIFVSPSCCSLRGGRSYFNILKYGGSSIFQLFPLPIIFIKSITYVIREKRYVHTFNEGV